MNELSILNITDDDNLKCIEIADDILKDILAIKKNYKKIIVKDYDTIWHDKCIKDRSLEFSLHYLVMVEYLIKAYQQTEKIKYINKAKHIVLNWKKNNFPYSESKMAWHDHATALRLIILCNFYLTWKEVDYNKKIGKEILELIEFHGEKLSDKSFYMENHNHGLDQDIALYIISSLLPSLPKSQEWKNLSLDRFWIQIERLFGEDGSYLEHSPTYGLLISKRILKFGELVKESDFKGYSSLKEVVHKQLIFLGYMLQPDGRMTPIGDSEQKELNIEKLENKSLEAIEFINKIKNGKDIKGKNTDKIYPDGGYLISRNKWCFDQDTIQSIFYSSFHSRVHKHHDDLSFTIYAKGQPVFIDGGKFNYNYKGENRKYIVSNKAHNTVMVDNMNTNIARLNIGQSAIRNYYFDDDISIGIAYHTLYEGVIHKRIFIFLKPDNFIVIDDLKGYKTHIFEHVFNLHPDLRLEPEKNSLLVLKDNKIICKINKISNGNENVELFKGNKDPMIGWVSLEESKIEPSNSLIYKNEARNSRFAININFNEEEKDINFEWKDDLIKIQYEDKELKIIDGDKENYLFINDSFIQMNTITNQALSESIKLNKSYEYFKKYKHEKKEKIKIKEKLNKLCGLEIKSLERLGSVPTETGQSINLKCIAEGEELKYAWYIYRNGEMIEQKWYTSEGEINWIACKSGKYKFKVFVKDKYENKISKFSSEFKIL